MKHSYHVQTLIATQRQAAMWSREASEMLALLATTDPRLTEVVKYRRMRAVVAQTNAATYHAWVAADLAK